MSTTVGTSRGLDMLGNHLFTALFKYARDRRPRIAALDEPAPGVSEPTAAMRIPEKRGDGAREVGGVVRADVMAARPDAEPLGANSGRDHGSPHRQRLENLQARAAAGSERHDVDRRFRNRRPDIVEDRKSV